PRDIFRVGHYCLLTDWSFVTISSTLDAPVQFRDLGVPQALYKVLSERGITTPFPIQAATLPDALAGRDVCGKAPTGSGKTLAFGIAVVEALAEGQRSKPRRPR